jgi:hypothetical protein
VSQHTIYLGDGVYATVERGMVKLMTGSHDNPDNTVYLDPQVLQSFLDWLKAARIIK